MPKKDPQFERKLAAIFQAEAADHVQRMQGCLAQLEAGDAAGAGKPMELLFRATHSLKGAARAVGEAAVEMVCHATESLLAAVQRGGLPWSPAVLDALHDTVAGLQQALERRGAADPGTLATLVARLERLERGEAAVIPPAPQATPAPSAAPAPGPAAAAEPPPAVAHDGGESVRIPVERLGRLLYQVEELLASRLHATLQLQELDTVLASFTALRAGAADADAALVRSLQQHEARLRSLRTTALREQRQLADAVDALLGDVKQTLLLPVGSLRPFLTATVRELARSQRKEVELRLQGDEVEMDRRLLEQLREPLVHLLRNAIGHGLEPPRERVAAGKPARGLLEVAIAARNDGQVEITVADDGAGIATARLAQAARAAGMAVPGEEAAQLLPLVFVPRVSTAERLTTVAGRGVGLAIVRETIEGMGGTISVASAPGAGTTFSIVLTTSLATYRAVEAQAGGRSFLLPIARVERGLRFGPGALQSVGGQQTVPVGEHALPLVSLAAVLGLPATATPASHIHCLVLSAGERRVAIAVDEIHGEQEVLGRPVDPAVSQSPVVAGAAMLASGRMAPILNVPELVRMALRECGRSSGASLAVAARPRGRSVLLAEDSITSRTLLKNILELAGHRVEVAVDGVEALDKLRHGGYDLVVSDVEMPRLDGIALTEAIRRDQALAHLPVVLVTSLGSPVDRERGAEAGANAYIVKSSFEQGKLLQAISELT